MFLWHPNGNYIYIYLIPKTFKTVVGYQMLNMYSGMTYLGVLTLKLCFVYSILTYSETFRQVGV